MSEWRLYALSAAKNIQSLFIQSGNIDYLINETRRKPATATRYPTLFDKGHGIFYMPSRTDTAGHTKAFDYPVMGHGGGGNSRWSFFFRCESEANRQPVDPQSNSLPHYATKNPHPKVKPISCLVRHAWDAVGLNSIPEPTGPLKGLIRIYGATGA